MIHGSVKFAAMVALIALASCGARDRSASQAPGEGATDNGAISKLSLASDAFRNGGAIPPQYTCDGANRSPALKWSQPPAGTKSFALVVDDPDATGGTFRHWAAFNIPASARELPAGGNPFGGALGQAVNDFGKPGYGGPCPPGRKGPHHYRFKLYALDAARLEIGSGPKIADVERSATQHALGTAQLIGTYERR